VLALAALLPLACGGEKPSPAQPPAPAPSLERYVLTSDPGEALSVEQARAAAPQDEVVVVGRVRNIVKGYASFQLADASLDYCGSRSDPMDNCPTPWDYCCLAPSEVNAKTIVVEVRDASGRPLATPALPGLRLLDLVAVKGRLVNDEHGVTTLVAAGWYRRARPELPDSVRWPD